MKLEGTRDLTEFGKPARDLTEFGKPARDLWRLRNGLGLPVSSCSSNQNIPSVRNPRRRLFQEGPNPAGESSSILPPEAHCGEMAVDPVNQGCSTSASAPSAPVGTATQTSVPDKSGTDAEGTQDVEVKLLESTESDNSGENSDDDNINIVKSIVAVIFKHLAEDDDPMDGSTDGTDGHE